MWPATAFRRRVCFWIKKFFYQDSGCCHQQQYVSHFSAGSNGGQVLHLDVGRCCFIFKSHPSSSLIYERGYLKLLKWFWWGVRRLVGKSGGNWQDRWWIFDCIESNLSQSLFLDGWQICKNLQNYVLDWHINIYPECASCSHTMSILGFQIWMVVNLCVICSSCYAFHALDGSWS